jgi:hypothetical protein
VAATQGIDVQERQYLSVFVDSVAGNLAANDLTEHRIRHVRVPEKWAGAPIVTHCARTGERLWKLPEAGA